MRNAGAAVTSEDVAWTIVGLLGLYNLGNWLLGEIELHRYRASLKRYTDEQRKKVLG